MQRVMPTIRLFTYQHSPETAGTEVVALTLEHRGNNYHLEGGTKDIIHVFSQSICLYVLTINMSHGYVGLNCYMAPEPAPINNVFLQTQRDITDALGKKWEELTPETIVSRLINHLN